MSTEHVSVPRDYVLDLINWIAITVPFGTTSRQVHRDKLSAILSFTTTDDERCIHCDGTGDVHRADGEWLGPCPECKDLSTLMEAWSGALDCAHELVVNAPDARYQTRALAVKAWVHRTKPIGDDFYCCNGADCGCLGITKREKAILSRATPSDVDCRTAGPGNGFCDMCTKGEYAKCRYINPAAPRVVTAEDVERAERAFWPTYLESIRVHGAKAHAMGAGMKAALATLPHAAVPAGYVVVPVEPTEEMLEQACTHDTTPRNAEKDQWNRDTWYFTIDAAPQPEKRG